MGNGATLVAKTNEKVKHTTTVTLTGRNIGVNLLNHAVRGLRGVTSRLDRCSIGMSTTTTSITSLRTIARTMRRVGSSLNSISVLVGGTKVTGFKKFLRLSPSR